MHVPNILSLPILSLALATTGSTAAAAAAASDAQNAATCQRKFGVGVTNAIAQFCRRSDMVVPSTYAADGVWAAGGHHVKITGDCGPPEWVPSYWCAVQLREVCAAAGENAVAERRFGWGGCQHFILESSRFEVEG
ncbi:hypothetical protein MBLNU459_g0038t1, partial [Dothideomycetes sp. NU459]